MIVLAGMIGAGKSTYTTMISKELKSEAFYETVEENPLLEKFMIALQDGHFPSKFSF